MGVTPMNDLVHSYFFRYYDFMGLGDFVLYKNTERNFEVGIVSLLKVCTSSPSKAKNNGHLSLSLIM